MDSFSIFISDKISKFICFNLQSSIETLLSINTSPSLSFTKNKIIGLVNIDMAKVNTSKKITTTSIQIIRLITCLFSHLFRRLQKACYYFCLLVTVSLNQINGFKPSLTIAFNDSCVVIKSAIGGLTL